MTNMRWYLIFLLFSLSLHAVEKNPHGSVFKVIEVEKKQSEKGILKVFKLSTENLKKQETFTLFGKNLSKSEKIGDYTVNADGVLTSLSDEVFGFFDQEFSQGEPYTFCLISKDRSTELYETIVPFPLEFFAKDRAKVSLIMLSSNARSFLCVGEKFHPNEPLKIVSHSNMDSDFLRLSTTTTKEGTVYFVLEPSVLTVLGGDAYVEFIREKETLHIDYSWGVNALKK